MVGTTELMRKLYCVLNVKGPIKEIPLYTAKIIAFVTGQNLFKQLLQMSHSVIITVSIVNHYVSKFKAKGSDKR